MLKTIGGEPRRSVAIATSPVTAALLGVAVLITGVTASAQPPSPGFSAYVTVASDYRRRGLSQSRGEPSIQLAADYQHRTGLFGGAWVATMKYATGLAPVASRQNETAVYLGYGRSFADWSVATSVTRYRYPGTPRDYDYSEVSGSVGFRDTVFVTVSHSRDLFGRDASALNREIGVAWPLPGAFEFGAALGRFDAKSFGVRYSHWNAGVSRVVGHRIGLDARYYDNSRQFVTALGTTSGDRWVVSASFGFGRGER